MDHWPSVTIENWEQFETFIEELSPSIPLWPSFIFRGQPVIDWQLIPSFCRHLPDNYPPQFATDIEMKALLEFRRKALLYLDAKFLPDVHDGIEWFHLMQHYSAPTRLLDWTFSPYVALYFAVNQNVGKDGAVWAFNRTELANRMGLLYGENYSWFNKTLEQQQRISIRRSDVDLLEFAKQYRAFQEPDPSNMIFVYDPSDRAKASERIIAQQGTFTYSKAILGKHDEGIHEAMSKGSGTDPKDTGTRYVKLRISSGIKQTFLEKLYTMNIHPAALFPGIDGLGRSIAGFIDINVDWMLKHHEHFTDPKS
jgi:hypothetical protein